MTNNPKTPNDTASTNAVKDPDNWTTGGEA